jgi:hypothetical protein
MWSRGKIPETASSRPHRSATQAAELIMNYDPSFPLFNNLEKKPQKPHKSIDDTPPTFYIGCSEANTMTIQDFKADTCSSASIFPSPKNGRQSQSKICFTALVSVMGTDNSLVKTKALTSLEELRVVQSSL